MQILSPVFSEKEKIPAKYTCDGEDINPPLEFIDVPQESRSLALLVEDPDSKGKVWIHWLVINIDPGVTFVPEDSVPKGGFETITDFGSKGYGGPCPAVGIHRYKFRLFALDSTVDALDDITLSEFEGLIAPHVITEAYLTGLYSRE